MKKLIIVLCFLFLLFVLWMSRYTIICFSTNGTQMPPGGFKLDRFTGKVTVLMPLLDKSAEYDIKKFESP